MNVHDNGMFAVYYVVFFIFKHYIDVMMSTIASQISNLTIVYSTVYSGADQRHIKAPRHCPLCGEFTGDQFP